MHMSNFTTLAPDVVAFAADPAHSRVGFAVRHMGFSKVRGRFREFDALVRMEPGDLASLEAEATAQTASIDTGAEDRDQHLRSEDFFASDEYPSLSFKSTEVLDVHDNRFTLAGDLTMRGVTRRVELQGTFLGEGTDPWGGRRIGFEAHGTISRKEFGLTWNQVLETGGVLVSDDVRLELEIQASELDEEG
jgi:polyisoprenoid-binding protein YceI